MWNPGKIRKGVISGKACISKKNEPLLNIFLIHNIIAGMFRTHLPFPELIFNLVVERILCAVCRSLFIVSRNFNQ